MDIDTVAPPDTAPGERRHSISDRSQLSRSESAKVHEQGFAFLRPGSKEAGKITRFIERTKPHWMAHAERCLLTAARAKRTKF